MPYYRKRSYGYKRYNKVPRRKPYSLPMRYKIADIAYKGYKIAKSIASKLNVEYKHHDVSATSNPPATGAVTSLCNIAQGDDNFNRSGRSILVKSIYMKGIHVINASAANTSTRIIIFRDNDSQGSTAGVTDVLDTASIIAPLNIDTDQKRFTVFYDKVVDLSDNGTRQRTVKKYIPCNFHMKFDGTANTDVSTNGVYMLLLSTEPTNTPEFSWSVRLRYIDN